MDHELTFQTIKDQVELPELLTHYGYTLKQGENLNKGKWHVFEGDDTLVVFKGRGNDWMYFNSQDDRDKGSVIDWMKNRVSTGRIAGIEQLPGRNLWQSVNDHFRTYLNLPEAERPKLDLTPLTPTEPGERFQSIYTKDCGPLKDTSFLESRGITKATLENPQFAGRVLNQYHTVQKEGMPAKTYVNTAFPTYHEGRVVGLELKGEGFKGQAPDSQFTRSLWLSKQPEGKPATQLVVSESALDTLSYAQLHPDKRSLYASTSGVLTQNKIFEMKRLVAAELLTGVKSAFDNDTQGHHFDTRLLAGFASEKNPMKVVREHQHLLTVEIATADTTGVQGLTQQLKTFNNQLSQQYNQANGSEPSTAAVPTLRDELIAMTKPHPNVYQFHIPMNRDALGAFNQAAVQHLQYEQKIELVKSQGKDWNQDLKEAQMQEVVKRELGPVQETKQPDKISQNAQEGPDKNERVVVVEFRESRDVMSQLNEVRDGLEKAGLKVDYGQKLEPNAPREIATQLTLRYPLDSPQLPTVSQALDTLATNPRATIIEPAQDATERRQLVAAQEQAKQQQQQAGPQIQPSESPAHDQARLVFVQAAGPVAKVLRESGAGLEAAFLQQLIKTAVRQPEIKGIDLEQLNKVMAKIDKVPALKDTPEVTQIRQAVQVLDKPVQGYGQAAQSVSQKQQKPEPPAQERKRGPRL